MLVEYILIGDVCALVQASSELVPTPTPVIWLQVAGGDLLGVLDGVLDGVGVLVGVILLVGVIEGVGVTEGVLVGVTERDGEIVVHGTTLAIIPLAPVTEIT